MAKQSQHSRPSYANSSLQRDRQHYRQANLLLWIVLLLAMLGAGVTITFVVAWGMGIEFSW